MSNATKAAIIGKFGNDVHIIKTDAQNGASVKYWFDETPDGVPMFACVGKISRAKKCLTLENIRYLQATSDVKGFCIL